MLELICEEITCRIKCNTFKDFDKMNGVMSENVKLSYSYICLLQGSFLLSCFEQYN